MPKALVIGSRGQDGAYLCELLESKGYDIIPFSRGGVEGPCSERYPCISLKHQEIGPVLHAERVNEIYYLAAFHHSSEKSNRAEPDVLQKSFEINTLGLAEVLYAIDSHNREARLFYAASSHIFGEPECVVQDEATPFNPVNAYGISKAAGVHVCRHFRKNRGLHACVGILYNHESPRRSAYFLSKKVVQAAVKIKRREQNHLALGCLDTLVDWGFAPDYVRAMWSILQLESPADFVIATGVLHSVRDFVATAFKMLGLEWSRYVTERADMVTKQQGTLCGNASALRRATRWEPEVGFEELVRVMIEAELKIVS